jgi:squalene-hopene cyclase-like protein/prenyltransferase/squalene oxidase-like repeat protein
MSWVVASTLILGAALVAGFAWYERTHPTTRVIALVATLAALAAIGRIAFAALPNVKPTTDIVFISGYVLGGAPGFAVGAVAALASNIFFGQGPWTPWQMTGWGGVGLIGALLGYATHRNLGRVQLAIACGGVSAAFGAWMNIHLWVTYSGEHTLAGLWAYFVTSLWFDVAHVAGSVVFCLAFGPALVRALARYRTRFDVQWAAAPAVATALLALVLVGPATARASEADAAAARASVRYLVDVQNDDGGWGAAPRQSSSQLYTGWTALGLAAAGRNPLDVGSPSAFAYIRAHAGELNDLGELNRTLLILKAAGRGSRIGGRDLEAAVASKQRRNGSFAGRVNTTAFAVLGLRAAGRSRRDRAIRRAAAWMMRQANDDGGYNFAGRGGPSGIDDTGAALQALGAAGRGRSRAAKRAVRFIVRNQASDGGFALIPGGPSNAQSTAWAVQGLLAAGRDPAKVRRSGSRDPMAYLRSLTASSGEVRYSRTSRQSPVWVTSQVVAALARKTLPLARVPRARAAAASAPAATPTAAPTEAPKPVKVQSLPPVGTPDAPTPPALAAAARIPAAGIVVAALM